MGIAFDDEVTDLILDYTGEAGIALVEKQAQLLSRHIRIMLEWNPRLNLTRITDREEIIIKHLLDSIAPAKYLPSSGYAVDIGTGAGFPGIPLKIVHPDLQMVLLESSRKKVSFLCAVTAALGLKGIRALHGRWQDFAWTEEHIDKFELITMRALRLEPEHITCLASSVLAPGGVLARWEVIDANAVRQGVKETSEVNCRDMEFQGDFNYSLPSTRQQRAVRLWRKTIAGGRGAQL